MNHNIEQGKEEFNKKNYKNALGYFRKVGNDDEDYEYAQVYAFSCLIEMGCYRDALKVINSLISKNPNSEMLWHEKSRCHIFLKENKDAYNALSELERVVDVHNKDSLVDVARLYSLLDDYDKVIEYCDKALAIDENYKPALYEKALVASSLNDDEMIDVVSKDILNVSEGDLFSIMPVFLLKLFSKKYEDCLEMVEDSDVDDVKEKFGEALKGIIYQHMTEDLNAKLLLSEDIDLPIGDALKLMFEFKNDGKDHGKVNGIQYFIL